MFQLLHFPILIFFFLILDNILAFLSIPIFKQNDYLPEFSSPILKLQYVLFFCLRTSCALFQSSDLEFSVPCLHLLTRLLPFLSLLSQHALAQGLSDSYHKQQAFYGNTRQEHSSTWIRHNLLATTFQLQCYIYCKHNKQNSYT